MAELATLARPYAEALFKAVSVSEAQSAATQLSELAQVASDERLKAFADNPRTTVAALKRALREVRELGRGEAMARERAAFSERWGGADHQAAMSAFTTKGRKGEAGEKG